MFINPQKVLCSWQCDLIIYVLTIKKTISSFILNV